MDCCVGVLRTSFLCGLISFSDKFELSTCEVIFPLIFLLDGPSTITVESLDPDPIFSLFWFWTGFF